MQKVYTAKANEVRDDSNISWNYSRNKSPIQLMHLNNACMQKGKITTLFLEKNDDS